MPGSLTPRYSVLDVTLFRPMEFYMKMHDNVWMVQCIYCRSQIKISKIIVFLSLKIHFVLANSADTDVMSQDAAIHLGRHCCQSTRFGVSCL